MACGADYVIITVSGVFLIRQLGGKNYTFLQGLSFLGIGALGTYIAWQQIKNWIHSLCAKNADAVNVGFRQKFKEEFVFLKERQTSESSNNIQMTRILAEESIKMFITQCGYTPYMFSSNTTKPTDDVDCHFIYTYRDLDIPWTYKQISDKHVLCMMDVKKGYDLKEWLWMGQPIILYSFYPTKVGGECMDGVFSIKDNIVTIQNKDGRIYQHQVLNTEEDYFVVRGLINSLVVTVDQFVDPCDPDRRVVCLTPTSWYKSVANWLTPNNLIHDMKTMKYQCGKGNMLLTLVQKGNAIPKPFISVGYEDQPENALIDYEQFIKFLQYSNYKHTSLDILNVSKKKMLKFVNRNGWLNSKNIMAFRLNYPTVGRIKFIEE